MITLIALSSTSCASKKRTYEVIKETDPWYEVTTFEVADQFPSDVYDYSYYETVGATSDAVYIKVDAEKIYPGDYSKLELEDYVNYYEQAILKYSFDGKLLEKTNYVSVKDGLITALENAWVSDGKLNVLQSVYDKDENSREFRLNGEKITIPDPSNNSYYKREVHIEDLFTTGGYKIFTLYTEDWNESTIVVERPDGSQYEPDFYSLFKYGFEGTYEVVPAGDGKIMIPVFLDNGMVYVLLDLESGQMNEVKGLYGSEEAYMLEHCNGKTLSRDFYGLNYVDIDSGKLIPIFDYSNVDESYYEIIETQTLYISDDAGEIILGGETYNDDVDGYRIMHLKRADRNPNAGKTQIILSLGEDAYPEYSDLKAATLYNRQNNPCFIKFVMPYNDQGEYKDVKADIILTSMPVASPSDSALYVDLAPYFDLNGQSFRDQYFMNAIDAAKTGDALYRMPLDIKASGIVTASSNVPKGQIGFTFDQYKKFVNDVCNGIDPVSRTPDFEMSKSDYFSTLFMNMSDIYIKDGKVDITGDEFRQLMLFVDEYGSDEGVDDTGIPGMVTEHNRSISEVEAELDSVLGGNKAEINGKLGAVYGNFYSFDNYLDRYERFGNEMGVYGLPSYDGRGPMTESEQFVSVSADTKYPDACADFVKLLISYDIQCLKESNPVNRDALRTVTEKKLEKYNSEIDRNLKYDPSLAKPKLTKDAVDKYIDILSSAYSGTNAGGAVHDILREESSSYFNGAKSMDDVIRVMQKRLQTVLDEAK